jgi:hypothetical protein
MVQVEWPEHMGVWITRYVVWPNSAFLTRLRASSSDVACILLGATLWSQKFGHRSRINHEVIRSTVKLVHVASLADLSGVEDLLCGPLEVSVAYFDQHWELIEIEFEDSVDDAMKRLPEELRDKVNGG